MGKTIDITPIIEWIEAEKGMLWAERQSALDAHDWERLRECERCLFLLGRVQIEIKYTPEAFAPDKNTGERWICVKEYLPEEDGEYIVRHHTGKILIATFRDGVFWDGENYVAPDHWMKKPE